MTERRIMCGDRVATPDGWTGRVQKLINEVLG